MLSLLAYFLFLKFLSSQSSVLHTIVLWQLILIFFFYFFNSCILENVKFIWPKLMRAISCGHVLLQLRKKLLKIGFHFFSLILFKKLYENLALWAFCTMSFGHIYPLFPSSSGFTMPLYLPIHFVFFSPKQDQFVLPKSSWILDIHWNISDLSGVTLVEKPDPSFPQI